MIIGIGGVSRSGKSTLAEIICSVFSEKKVEIISQDNFAFNEDMIPRIKNEIDWECPDSIDFNRFREGIRNAEKEHDIVIAEGLLVFYEQETNVLFDKKIFIQLPENVFRERKISDKRWGSFPDWYIDHIWNSFLKYGYVDITNQDYLHLDGSKPFNEELIRDSLIN